MYRDRKCLSLPFGLSLELHWIHYISSSQKYIEKTGLFFRIFAALSHLVWPLPLIIEDADCYGYDTSISTPVKLSHPVVRNSMSESHTLSQLVLIVLVASTKSDIYLNGSLLIVSAQLCVSVCV